MSAQLCGFFPPEHVGQFPGSFQEGHATQVRTRCAHPESRSVQNCTLAPNWICRDVVEVAVITPAVGEIPDAAEE